MARRKAYLPAEHWGYIPCPGCIWSKHRIQVHKCTLDKPLCAKVVREMERLVGVWV